MKDCTRCELHTKCDHVKITSRSKPAKIMLVLDAPNRGDDRKGQILASDTYLKYRYFLERCGLSEDDVYTTYAVKCFTGKKISDVKPKHIEACRAYLEREIIKVKPTVIITAGKVAHQALTRQTSVEDFRGHFCDYTLEHKVKIGERVRLKTFTTKIMPTLSIDSSMFAWTHDDYIIHDIKKAMKYVETGIVPVTPIPKWELITDIDRLEKVADYLSKQKYTFFDTETTGLEYYNCEIVNVGFAANPKKVFIWYIMEVPEEHMKKYTDEEKQQMRKINAFTRKYKTRIVAAVKKIMESQSRKIAHNIKFDLRFIYTLGIQTENIYFDTMVADALIDENKWHDLNSCMEYRGLNFGPYDTNLWKYVNKDKKKKKPYSWVPPNKLCLYLAIDVGGLTLLTPKIMRELKHPRTAPNQYMYKLMFEQQMPLLRLLFEMELDGFNADIDMLRDLGDKVGRKIERIKERFEELTEGEVNINSPDQLSKYLEENNYPFDKVNAKKGAKGYSVDKKVMNAFTNIKKYRRIPSLVVKYRELSKLKSTYIDGKDGEGGLVKMVAPDGKFHTNYNLHIARTGRLSSNNPNCLSLDTEVLTEQGWKRYDEIEGLKVFQFDKDKDCLELVNYDKYYISPYQNHQMSKIVGKYVDIDVTQNHRCLFKDKDDKYVVTEAKYWKPDRRFIHSAKYRGYYNFSNNVISFICSFKFFGFVGFCGSLIFDVDAGENLGKISEIDYNLKAMNVRYRIENNDYIELTNKRPKYQIPKVTFKILKENTNLLIPLIEEFLADGHFSYKLMELSYDSRVQFLNFVEFWGKGKNLSKKDQDVIQAIKTITPYNIDNPFDQIKRKKYSYTDKSHHTNYTSINQVWCISVPSGFIVTRHNDKVAILGNCQNIPNKGDVFSIRKVFIPPKGQVVWECDFSQLELRIIAYLAQDKVLIQEFQNGDDMHSKNAVMFGRKLGFINQDITLEEFLEVYNYVAPEGWKESDIYSEEQKKEIEDKLERKYLAKKVRNLAKKIAFGLNYGIEVPTVAEEFGLSNDQTQDAFDEYFNKYRRIDEFSNSQIDEVLKKGYLEIPITHRRRRFTQAVRWLRSEWGSDYYARRFLVNEIERQAKNFKVQALANEIYVKAKLKLAKFLKKHVPTAKLRLTIHDGMVNTGYLKDMNKIEKIVQKSFFTYLGEGRWKIPLPSDLEVFTRWEGDQIDYKKEKAS